MLLMGIYIMLHSGRSVPQDGTAVVRREGAGIIFDPKATAVGSQSSGRYSALS